VSYDDISRTTPRARKPHKCIWCGEQIEVGEKHHKIVGKYFGEFQNHRFHDECLDESHEHCDENDGEFFPYENERPERKKSNEQTD